MFFQFFEKYVVLDFFHFLVKCAPGGDELKQEKNGNTPPLQMWKNMTKMNCC